MSPLIEILTRLVACGVIAPASPIMTPVVVLVVPAGLVGLACATASVPGVTFLLFR